MQKAIFIAMVRRLYTLLYMLFGTGALLAQQNKITRDADDAIYKHYTGIIGKRHVVLDLRYGYIGASNYGGSYFYYTDEPGIHHFYIFEPPTYAHAEELHSKEDPDTPSLLGDANFAQKASAPTWNFHITGNKLTGKWHSSDGKQALDVDLTEDYSHSAPLGYFWIFDSTAIENEHDEFEVVKYSLMSITPDSTTHQPDASFINNALLKFWGISSWDDYGTIYQRRKPPHHFKNVMELPVYNDNGLLVLQVDGWDNFYTGLFSRGIVAYLYLDVQNKKVLSLNDVIHIDTPKLAVVLEKELRKKYKPDPRKKIGDILSVDTIPITDKVMPSNKGFIFSYEPQDILPPDKTTFALDEIRIFIPYAEIGDMLNPEFKKRFGL